MGQPDVMGQPKSVTVVVAGRVQGVAYRAWTKREADGRGLTGHVRNCADGTVEAVFTGPETEVDAMVQACWAGPPGARVETVSVAARATPESGTGFAIAH
ncbi:acylphosphatase [uncultured Methylobacterium sp.]|uniref:acylphosphatase n=1 Tax=uncultured Methylobacterium sp. TaxID=157278 RepID=UPI0035CB5A35